MTVALSTYHQAKSPAPAHATYQWGLSPRCPPFSAERETWTITENVLLRHQLGHLNVTIPTNQQSGELKEATTDIRDTPLVGVQRP